MSHHKPGSQGSVPGLMFECNDDRIILPPLEGGFTGILWVTENAHLAKLQILNKQHLVDEFNEALKPCGSE